MIFYLANGITLCGTQAEAKALDRDFVQHDIPTEKPKLQAYVQDLMNKVDDLSCQINSLKFDTTIAPVTITDDLPSPPLPVVQDLDDVWEELPLARKAHFAALFCEEARLKIK